ncbi:MAG TPA: DUF4157 domain-containing protein [Kofleriaceae bacterium]|nr:DUF4157 domain-containing protein [Kofleriaceae bacterium]
MAFEREKQAATSPKELERLREQELALARERARRKKAALEPGRATLVDQQAPAPAGRDFHREAMTDVVDVMGSIARGERSGQLDDATGPAMWRVAEARALTMFRHAVDEGEIDAHDPAVDESLRRAGGGGQALPNELKRQMEDEFGVAFDRVRIHTDGVAADAARAIHADAFTVGEDIFFGAGTFTPSSQKSRSLVAHELAHVVQSWQGRTGGAQHRQVSKRGDALEHEAEAVAARIESTPKSRARGSAPAIRGVAPEATPPHGTQVAKPKLMPAPAVRPFAAQLLRRETDDNAPPPQAPQGTTGNTVQSNQPDVTVQRDYNSEQSIHQAHKITGDAKTEIHSLAQNMHQSTQSASNHLTQTLHATKTLGKHDALHAANTAQHAVVHDEANKHIHAAQAHAQQHHAVEQHHEPAPNPSAHDGVGGIQFKPISDWSKLMPKPLPDQDDRERAKILKLVQGKVEKERKESAQLLSSLKNAQLKAAGQIRGLKGGLQKTIAGAQAAATAKTAAAEAAQAAAIQSHVAGVQASVRGAAAAQKAAVTQAHTQTVQQINQGAQQATQKLAQAHQQAVQTLQQQEAQQHVAVTAAFQTAQTQITALGAQKASQAEALPDSISLPYSGDQLSAAKKAAHKVGDQYSQAMPEQATKASGQLLTHEPDTQDAVTKITTQITAKVEEAFDQCNKLITQTREQSIQAADKAKDQSLQQIEQTASSTVASLSAFGASQVASIHQQGASAKQGIASAGASAIAGVGKGVDDAVKGLETGAQGLEKGAKDVEAPTVAATEAQVKKAGDELRKSVPSIASGLQKNASDSAASLAKQAASAASAMAQAATKANQQATQMGAQASQTLEKLGQGAVKTLGKVRDGATKQFDKATEDGTKAFTACTQGQAHAYSEQISKLKTGLDGAVHNVSDSFNKAVPTKETADILAAAKKAAASVPKHWWQKALAFVVSIVVAVIVVVAVTALIAVTGPIGMILVGALAGALASVLSTMASNLILGNSLFEGITIESVALGAVGGALTGGMMGAIGKGVLGETIAQTVTFEGGLEGLQGFAVRTGVNSAVGMVSDAGAQLIVTGKYEFSMQTLVTTIATSAASSTSKFDEIQHTTGNSIRESVGLDSLPAHGGGSTDPTGGADNAGATPGSTEAKGDTGSSSNSSNSNSGGSSSEPVNTNAPTGAKGNDTGSGGAPKGADPSTSSGAANTNQPVDAKGGANNNTNNGGAGHDNGPAGGATGNDNANGGHAPTNDNANGGHAPTNDNANGGHAPTNDNANANAGHAPTNDNANGGHAPTNDNANAGHAPTNDGKTTPATNDNANRPPATKANDNAPPEAKAPSGGEASDSGGGGGGDTGASNEAGGSATDQALEQDGYKNASPEAKANAEAKLRSGEHPTANDLRDTAANQRGAEKLGKLDQELKPTEKTDLNNRVADKLAEKPEGTGALDHDVDAAHAAQKEAAANNTRGKAAAAERDPTNAAHAPDGAPGDGAAPASADAASGPAADPAHAPEDPTHATGPEGSVAPDGSVRTSPEDVLRAHGLSEDDINVLKKALTKDAQGSKGGNNLNADGSAKAQLTPEEMSLLVKAHDILLQDVREGQPIRKFIPNKDVGSVLHGESVYNGKVVPADQMRGDIALPRNTDGMNAHETVSKTGLDYEHNPHGEHAGQDRQGQYTDQDKAGKVSLSNEVSGNGLHYLEMPMSAEQASAAQVPLANDLFEVSQHESASPDRYKLKPRDGGQDNPYTGTGATQPGNLEGFQGAINQELNAGSHAIVEGANLKVRGASGADQTVATYTRGADGKLHWELSPDLSPSQHSYYDGLIKDAQAKADGARKPSGGS